MKGILLALVLVACAQTSGTVRGVVVGVEGSLDEVTSFTVLVDGEEVGFVPVAGGDYDFPLSHLRTHQRSGEPVLVTWAMEDGVRHAVALADG
ncbi:MAG: hypothetical protein ACRDVL_12125 [Acidimicrobiia bacterium]